MNFYRFVKDIYSFFEECQEGAKEYPEIGGHIECLDPFTDEINRSCWVLEDHNPHWMDATNYRVDIFETNTGDLVWAFYSPQAEATDNKVQNSHFSLAQVLWKDHVLETQKRWCGFYSRIMGNGNDDFLVLYGMSSDYPHNQYSDEVLKKFVDKILLREHGLSKVIVIGDDIKCYTAKDVEPPF